MFKEVKKANKKLGHSLSHVVKVAKTNIVKAEIKLKVAENKLEQGIDKVQQKGNAELKKLVGKIIPDNKQGEVYQKMNTALIVNSEINAQKNEVAEHMAEVKESKQKLQDALEAKKKHNEKLNKDIKQLEKGSKELNKK